MSACCSVSAGWGQTCKHLGHRLFIVMLWAIWCSIFITFRCLYVPTINCYYHHHPATTTITYAYVAFLCLSFLMFHVFLPSARVFKAFNTVFLLTKVLIEAGYNALIVLGFFHVRQNSGISLPFTLSSTGNISNNILYEICATFNYDRRSLPLRPLMQRSCPRSAT